MKFNNRDHEWYFAAEQPETQRRYSNLAQHNIDQNHSAVADMAKAECRKGWNKNAIPAAADKKDKERAAGSKAVAHIAADIAAAHIAVDIVADIAADKAEIRQDLS